MSKISIAEQQKQINKVLTESKQRLKFVQQKIELLSREHQSILQDIELLTARKAYSLQNLEKKEKVYQTVDLFVNDAELSYNKLVDSTQALLGAFKKQSRKMEEAMRMCYSDQ